MRIPTARGQGYLCTCMCHHRGIFWPSNSLLGGKCSVYCFHTFIIVMWGSGGLPLEKILIVPLNLPSY